MRNIAWPSSTFAPEERPRLRRLTPLPAPTFPPEWPWSIARIGKEGMSSCSVCGCGARPVGWLREGGPLQEHRDAAPYLRYREPEREVGDNRWVSAWLCVLREHPRAGLSSLRRCLPFWKARYRSRRETWICRLQGEGLHEYGMGCDLDDAGHHRARLRPGCLLRCCRHARRYLRLLLLRPHRHRSSRATRSP